MHIWAKLNSRLSTATLNETVILVGEPRLVPGTAANLAGFGDFSELQISVRAPQPYISLHVGYSTAICTMRDMAQYYACVESRVPELVLE